jgi:hypothetical protein
VAVVSRAFWFAAGVASGVYGVFKVKRTVEIFTPDGIGARVAALRRGAQVFADEVSGAAHEREAELLSELRTSASDHRLLPAAESVAIPGPRHARPTGSLADRTPMTDLNEQTRTGESVTDGNR